jgi:hypothetical protein
VHLKLAPSEFWAMTPGEFEGLCKQFLKAQPGYVEPVTWEEFAALRKRFPDGPSKRMH